MAKKKKRRVKKKPSQALHDTLTPGLRMALAQKDHGNRRQALQRFDDAVRLDPSNVRAYVLAARAHAEANQLDRMEEILAQLVRRAPPEDAGVHHYVGEVYARADLPDKAIDSYERACTLPNVQPGTWVELASMYERSHRLEEAWDLIQRTEEFGIKFPSLWLIKARLQRRRKEPVQAEATLQALADRLVEGHEVACEAWGEIALIRDREGDYKGAAEAIGNCKHAQRKRAANFGRGGSVIHRELQELFATLRREDFVRWQNRTKGMNPARVALLTGFPRSGTTLLEQVLDAHPRVISSEERDYMGKTVIHRIFGNQRPGTPLYETLNKLTAGQLRFERDTYFRVMEEFLGEEIGTRMHLDKNPGYNQTIPLILRIFPETRLLIALRDPRDVVLSCYLRYLPLNTMSAQFLSVKGTARRYAVDMEAWLTFRKILPGPWREIRYEDSVADLESQARAALSTLGLPWDEAVLRYRQRLKKEKRVTSPTYEAVALPVYTRSLARWRNYEKLLEPAQKILQPFIKAFGYE
jgi:Tfp pilus assembly protein PilF